MGDLRAQIEEQIAMDDLESARGQHLLHFIRMLATEIDRLTDEVAELRSAQSGQ
jgi:hypothetical protein